MRSHYADGVAAAGAVVLGTGVIDPDFPHSYKGLDAEVELARWIELLRESTYVGVRGPWSAAVLADRGYDVEVLGDAAAAFVKPDGYWHPGSAYRVGLNVGHSFGRVWGSELKMLGTLVDFAAALHRAGALLEYFVVWPQDLGFTRQVARESGTEQAPIHIEYASGNAYQESVRHLSAFIGVKLHATALAAAAGVPVISFGYQSKCFDFMSSVGLSDLCIRTDAIGLSNVMDLVDELSRSGATRSVGQLAALRSQRMRQVEICNHLLLDPDFRRGTRYSLPW